MARPLVPTFNSAQQEELRRLASDDHLVMQDTHGTVPMRTSEPDQLRWLLNAEPTVLAHSHSTTPPSYRTHPASPPLVSLEPDTTLKKIGYAWQQIHAVIGPFLLDEAPDTPAKRLAPRLDAFYRAYQPLMEAYQYSLFNAEQVVHEDICHDIDRLLKEGFEHYQQAVRSPEMKRAIKHHQVNHNRNRLSMLRYLDALFEAYPSLYVLHLDLGYSVRLPRTAIQATYPQLREDLKTLFYARHANPMWKDDLVGHIWKIEDAPERRFHAHLLLFYNGSTADHHLGDAEHLRHRWIKEITHQEGALFERKGDPASVLVPENTGYLVSRDDQEAIDHLKDYLTYLIRISQLFGLDTHRQAHVFAKGHAPRRKQRTTSE